MTKETAAPEKVTALPTHYIHQIDVFSDPASFEHAQRVAKVFASSTLVPSHLRGNLSDCIIAYQIARRLNEEPLTVFQNIYVVNGRPGWKTEYVIARANKSNVFKGRITWETKGQGDSLGVTAKVALADTGEIVEVTCDMKMAKADGWIKNPKYISMPEHMLRWRSAAMLIRLYAPEVMLGMPIVEELETLPAPMRDVTPKQSLTDALDALAKAVPADEGQTIENSEQPSESQGATSTGHPGPATDGEPAATEGQLQPGKAGVAAGEMQPTSEVQYAAYFHSWLSKARDADEAERRWKSEKKLRATCQTDAEMLEVLEDELRDRINALRSRK